MGCGQRCISLAAEYFRRGRVVGWLSVQTHLALGFVSDWNDSQRRIFVYCVRGKMVALIFRLPLSIVLNAFTESDGRGNTQN